MSDILIKNMEMPKEGRLVLAICPDGAVYEYFGDQNKYGGYRIDSAQKYLAKSPAEELPPHGRLGDLDLVEEWMRKKHKENDCPFNIDAFLVALKKFPTIVEASNE